MILFWFLARNIQFHSFNLSNSNKLCNQTLVLDNKTPKMKTGNTKTQKTKTPLFLILSCWKVNGADVTEVVDRGRKLYSVIRCNLARCPSPLSESQINLDEAQKLTWKETKCLYGLIKLITSNNVSELLKMQLNLVEKPKCSHLGDLYGFISTHAVTTRKSITGGHIGKRRICVRLQLVWN